MNKTSGRIRALSWYLIIAYQSHNNKNDHLTRPREGPRLISAWVSRYITLAVLINNYCYVKSQERIPGDFLFVDLRKELNSLTSRFCTSNLSISIIIHDATKSRTRTSSLKLSVSYEKDTTKDSKAKQLIRLWPPRTIPNQNEPKLLFETGNCPVSNNRENGNLRFIPIQSERRSFFSAIVHWPLIYSLAKYARFCEPGVVTFFWRHFLFLCLRANRRQLREKLVGFSSVKDLIWFSLIWSQFQFLADIDYFLVKKNI